MHIQCLVWNGNAVFMEFFKQLLADAGCAVKRISQCGGNHEEHELKPAVSKVFQPDGYSRNAVCLIFFGASIKIFGADVTASVISFFTRSTSL